MRRRIAGNKTSKFKDYLYVNNDTYIDYLERLKKIAVSIFDWVNLPDSMDARYLEKCLYYSGQAGLLKNEQGILINTRACASGKLNIYELPTQINCYSVGHSVIKNKYDGLVPYGVNPDDYCIYVLNNENRLPTAFTLELFAYRLYLAQRTADININANKMPYVASVSENRRLTLENLFNQIDENKPAIFGDEELKTMMSEGIKIINTNVPFIADKLMNYKKEIWNEALMFLGINNLSEKKERLITSETASNNEVVNLNLQSYLIPRKKACEQFNKLFGLTGDKAIDVRVRSDLYNVIKSNESIISDYNGDGIVNEKDLKEGDNE